MSDFWLRMLITLMVGCTIAWIGVGVWFLGVWWRRRRAPAAVPAAPMIHLPNVVYFFNDRDGPIQFTMSWDKALPEKPMHYSTLDELLGPTVDEPQ